MKEENRELLLTAFIFSVLDFGLILFIFAVLNGITNVHMEWTLTMRDRIDRILVRIGENERDADIESISIHSNNE